MNASAAVALESDWTFADARRPEVAVNVEDVHKRYGDVVALGGVSLEVRAGEILGLLGPNGAGKTTLIEILEGLRSADAGRVVVLGHDAADRQERRALRERMGVAMQQSVLPPLLTVRELMGLYAALFRHAQDPDTLMVRLGLEEKRQARIRDLSGGQQQRLSLALALLGNPEILFLDEPTSQLDPQARRAAWDLLLDEQERGKRTVLLTTHQMEEAQQLCSQVAIIDHGRILDTGSPSELIERHCPGRVVQFTTRPDADLGFLAAATTSVTAGRSSLTVTVRTERTEQLIDQVMAARRQGRLPVEDLRMERQTLEDVFLHLTGRRVRD
jgi:ABC-2 type transport system ATP-binding protein